MNRLLLGISGNSFNSIIQRNGNRTIRSISIICTNNLSLGSINSSYINRSIINSSYISRFNCPFSFHSKICRTREYHSSTINFGRHVGSKALDPQPRAFSKKQEKRRARRLLFKAERVDMRKQKLKDRFFKDQVKSKDTKDYIEKEKNKLGDIIKSLMLPDVDADISDLEDMIDVSLPDHINATYVLDKLRKMNNMLPSTSENALSTMSKRTSIKIIDDKIINNDKNTIEIDYEKCNEFLMELLQNNETRKQGMEMSKIMNDLHIPYTQEYHQFKMNLFIKRKQYAEAIDYFKSIILDDMISVNLRVYNSFLYCLMKSTNSSRENAGKEALNVINEGPYAAEIVKVFLDDFAEQMEENLMKAKFHKYKHHKIEDRIKKVEDQFNDLMLMQLVPDSRHWAALLRCKAMAGTEKGGDDALELMERLKKLNVPTTPSMYAAILEAYVDGRAFEKSKRFWLEMHHVGSEILTKQAFDIMLKRCSITKEAERAFFYMDEMKSLQVSPDVETFVRLFRACAEAPHWVDGYQDTIFDAMSRMEGAEIIPTTKIYNTIIYAFGRAGDSVAAEYYFWEMKRKGIAQNRVTYNSLLNAFGTEQLVYAKKYNMGIKGRYAKPADEELSEDEKDIATVGATRVAELYTQGIDQDTVERGSRQKTMLTDSADDNEEYQEAIMEQIRHEAREKRKLLPPPQTAFPQLTNPYEARARTQRIEGRSKKPELESDLNSESINDLDKMEADPEIQALLKEMGQTSLKSLLESDELFADQDEIVNENSPVENIDPDELNNLLAQFEKMEQNDKQNKSNKMSKDSINELMSDMKSLSSTETRRGGRRKDKRIPRRPNKMTPIDDEENFLDELFKDSGEDSYLSKKKMIKNETVYDRNDNLEEYTNPFTEEQFQPPMTLRSHDSIEKEKELAKNEVIDLLDGSDQTPKINLALANNDSDMTTNDLMKQLLSGISSDDIDNQWKMIEFGRAPEANYTEERDKRTQSNINKAEKVFHEMKRKNIKPDAATLTSLLKVYADADQVENALNIFDNYFSEYKVPQDARAYRVIVRMYVRTNNIDKALDITKEMEQKGLMNDSETYGILITSLTQRDMFIEALKFLEEATDKNVHIPNRHVKLLRTRCEKLGIVHPNMPDDPHQWIKNVKRVRYDSRHNSKRNIEAVRSALYS